MANMINKVPHHSKSKNADIIPPDQKSQVIRVVAAEVSQLGNFANTRAAFRYPPLFPGPTRAGDSLERVNSDLATLE